MSLRLSTICGGIVATLCAVAYCGCVRSPPNRGEGSAPREAWSCLVPGGGGGASGERTAEGGWRIRSSLSGLLVDAGPGACPLDDRTGALCTRTATIAFAVPRSFGSESALPLVPASLADSGPIRAGVRGLRLRVLRPLSPLRVEVRHEDGAWEELAAGGDPEVISVSDKFPSYALRLSSAREFRIDAIAFARPRAAEAPALCRSGGEELAVHLLFPRSLYSARLQRLERGGDGRLVAELVSWQGLRRREALERVDVDEGLCECGIQASVRLEDGGTLRCPLLGFNGYWLDRRFTGLLCGGSAAAEAPVAIESGRILGAEVDSSRGDGGGHCPEPAAADDQGGFCAALRR